MDLTFTIADETIREARRRADSMGTSVDQLVSDYLDQFAGKSNFPLEAAEFERLSCSSRQTGASWKFDRNELHDRQ